MCLKLIKKIAGCCALLLYIFIVTSYVTANNIIEDTKEAYGLNDMIDMLEEYAESLDLETITNNLIKGEGLEITSVWDVFVSLLFKEVKLELKMFVKVFIVIILLSITKCLELEKNSLDKIINIVGFLTITSMILKNYIEVLVLFKGTISSMTKIIEIVSPVTLTLLIATGEIVTSGIIGPVIMFLTAVCGVIANYIVLPLLNITLVFKIISGISESINLDKLGSFVSKSAMWVVSIVFALVLGVLGLETSVSTSVDAVTIKTTQAAVSNLIPVVGKFVSDSAELVMGATEIIGKTVGTLGIIIIIVVLSIPAIKLFLIGMVYGLLEGVTESLMKESKTTKIIGAFSKQYTTLAGIMIGIGTTFIITLALVISLFGKAVSS